MVSVFGFLQPDICQFAKTFSSLSQELSGFLLLKQELVRVQAAWWWMQWCFTQWAPIPEKLHAWVCAFLISFLLAWDFSVLCRNYCCWRCHLPWLQPSVTFLWMPSHWNTEFAFEFEIVRISRETEQSNAPMTGEVEQLLQSTQSTQSTLTWQIITSGLSELRKPAFDYNALLWRAFLVLCPEICLTLIEIRETVSSGCQCALFFLQVPWKLRRIYCLPLAKRFREKGYQENDKTVAMAPSEFLNEDVETAGSTKDIRVYYIYPDSHSIAKLIISPLNIAIEMAPGLSCKNSSRTSTSGVCQDSFRNPGAGKPRICQDNGSEYKFAAGGQELTQLRRGLLQRFQTILSECWLVVSLKIWGWNGGL